MNTFITALPGAVAKLDPRSMWRNPVMFVVEVGAVLTTLLAFAQPFLGAPEIAPFFTGAIALWLWATVLFANLAESVAEGRGKAQAASLRETRTSTIAHRVGGPDDHDTRAEDVSSADLVLGDYVVVSTDEVIPGDGDIVWGIASVDESAITGESAPVIREHGGDRSAVTGGTRVLSDKIVVRITSKPGETFVDRMIRLVEGASRQKTPNEIALNILLAALSIVFLVVVLTLNPMASYAGGTVSIAVLVALLVTLIPTTIGALLSAIGIAGMDRLVQHNVLAMSGRAVEAAGDVTTLLLDKTGTITYGNRQASEFLPVAGVELDELIEAARLSSLSDPTPEGQSIVTLAGAASPDSTGLGTVVPFTAQTRMSGLDLPDGTQVRKGAGSMVAAWAGGVPDDLEPLVTAVSESGGTPLVVATRNAAGDARVLGVIHLKDVVKQGLKERFAELRAMGIRTVMITGDNPLTAKAIAAEAGVDDFLAEATPEDKMELIKREQAGGNLVAMTGDGTNDAPALAQADVGVAMNTGTSAAKEAGNMVDLDSDPTKLIDIVRIGKQLLITRGSLTTFSIANDVAKYFAIIPAMFAGVFPGLAVLNIMALHSPASAILSAIIFNALVIIALIPLALRGVRYRAVSASKLLSRNLLIYGLGGIIAPFIGIKLIDLVVSLIPRILEKDITMKFRQTWTAVRALLILTVVLGIGYPLVITGIGQLAFPAAANGSLVRVDGEVVGSALIGQSFTDADGNPLPEWFQSRPSATGYDGGASSGSNLGPGREEIGELTASGSGLDPHISPEYARSQVATVAEARGLDEAAVATLVESMIQGRDLGYLGEPTVNVLRLNIALAEMDN